MPSLRSSVPGHAEQPGCLGIPVLLGKRRPEASDRVWEKTGLLRQGPFAALDLQHAERRQVQPQMIGCGHVESPARADKTPGRFDRVAYLDFVGTPSLPDRFYRKHQAVIGVAAECRNVLLVDFLERF